MSSREEFAGIAPSGRVVISGATTGLEVLKRALACAVELGADF